MFLPTYLQDYPPRVEESFSRSSVEDIIFVNIAYRPRPPGVATGGPNGVLRVQEELVGPYYRGFFQKYFFEPTGVKMPSIWQRWIQSQSLGTISRKLIEAHYFVQHILPGKLNQDFASTPGRKFYFVCHDIGSAAAAHLCGYPFALVYHQQGSFVHERTSFGENLSDAERYVISTFEKLAFENADRVYFPSRGAKDAFSATTEVVDLAKVRFGERPLYNTVGDFEADQEGAELFLMSQGYGHLVDPDVRSNYLIFVSVGDYTKNKGIDRCPKVLSEIARRTSKKVLWIVLGSKHRSGIYEDLKKRRDQFPFETILIPSRQPHNLTMGLVQFSDWLLMLQRYSIFDFSTLEALKLGTGVILSPVGGNLEFNTNSNICFVDPESSDLDSVQEIAVASPEDYGRRNREAFETSFSSSIFAESYRRMYDDLIQATLGLGDAPPFSKKDASFLKSKLAGRSVVICGPGASVKRLQKSDYEGKLLVALNSALLLDLPFFMHFMQDMPQDATFWPVYLKKEVIRVYGVIGRKATRHLGIDFGFLDKLGVDYTPFRLASTVFDDACDEIRMELDKEPVSDLKGILFSALQILGWAGVASIEIAGIDFSDKNYGGSNPNKYNFATLDNLRLMKEAMNTAGIPFQVLHSDSVQVQEIISGSAEERCPWDDVLASVVSPKRSRFRNLQALCAAEHYEAALEYVRRNPDVSYYREPKFLREIAQVHFALEDYVSAYVHFALYFKAGGDSNHCQAMMNEAETRVGEFEMANFSVGLTSDKSVNRESVGS